GRRLPAIKSLILFGNIERSMRRVGGDVAEERLSAAHAIYPLRCLPEEHIGAVAVRLLEPAVVFDHRIEIAIPRGVATRAVGIGLPDPPCPMNKNLIKPAAIRLISVLVSQVPLPEDSGGVARGL